MYFHQHGISLISDPQHWLHFFLREFMTVPLQLKQEGAKIDCLTTVNIVDGKKGQFTYIKGAQNLHFQGEIDLKNIVQCNHLIMVC